jgi:hypothetical protein
MQLQSVQNILSQCCPTCNLPPCTVALKGVCCPFSASSTVNSAAVASFSQALEQFNTMCGPTCTGTCSSAPSNECNPSTMQCQ